MEQGKANNKQKKNGIHEVYPGAYEASRQPPSQGVYEAYPGAYAASRYAPQNRECSRRALPGGRPGPVSCCEYECGGFRVVRCHLARQCQSHDRTDRNAATPGQWNSGGSWLLRNRTRSSKLSAAISCLKLVPRYLESNGLHPSLRPRTPCAVVSR